MGYYSFLRSGGFVCGWDCWIHLFFGHLLTDSISQLEHFRSATTGTFPFLGADGIGGEIIDTIVEATIHKERIQ